MAIQQKPTYHVLVSNAPKGSVVAWHFETYKKPFNFAPFDTLYSHDFNVTVYLDNGAENMGDFDSGTAAMAAIIGIQNETGMEFDGQV